MSQDLILKPGPGDSVAWSIVDRAAGKRLRDGRLAAGEMVLPAGDMDDVTRTLVLLPSEALHLSRLSLPARSEHQARQAAPYLIEDELASRLDETQVCPGPRGPDGQRWVVAAAIDQIEAWRARLMPLVQRPAFVVPDSFAAAEPGAALTLYDRGDVILFAHDPDAGDTPPRPLAGAMDAALFGSVIQPLVEAAGSGEIAVSRSLGLTGANFRAIGQGELDLRASALPPETLATLPRLFGDSLVSTLDLPALVRPLRRPLGLVAALLVGFGLLLGGETVYYRLQADRFEAATLAVFHHARPDFGRPVIAAEAERLLRDQASALASDDESVFLQLLAALDALTDGTETVRIDHVRYDPARAMLSVGATYSDFSDFDRLNDRAGQLGLRLEDGGAREGTAGIEGEFVVRLS